MKTKAISGPAQPEIAAETQPSDFIEFTHPMQLSQKEKQSLAYVQAHSHYLQSQAQLQYYKHAVQWLNKQNPAPITVMTLAAMPLVVQVKIPSVEVNEVELGPAIELNEPNEPDELGFCTCDHRFGATPHAWDCPLSGLSDAAVTVAKLGPAK